MPTKVDVENTLPGPADTLLERDATVFLTEPDVEIPKDLLTSQATSLIKVETQVVPTTGLVVELAGPLTSSNQAKGERWCMLVVTASMRRLNLEATRVTFRDTVTASDGRVAFKNPKMAAVLPGPNRGRKVLGHQDTIVEELAGRIWQENACRRCH